MAKFKVTIHCGQVNTFQIEEGESKLDLLNQYLEAISLVKETNSLLVFADLIINTNQITFVVVEEVVEKPLTSDAELTIEA